MLGLLYQYLINNNRITIPGLGMLLVHPVSSESDITDHTISPPLYTFTWQQESTVPPKDFFVWLAKKLNLAEEDAVLQINNFVVGIKTEINAGREVKWDGVGVIRRGFDSGIEFEPEKRKLFFDEAVQAHKVVHENFPHTLLVGDIEKTSDQMNEILLPAETNSNWFTSYKVAIILLIISLLFIIWYFFQNSINVTSVSSKTKLMPKQEQPTYKRSQ